MSTCGSQRIRQFLGFSPLPFRSHWMQFHVRYLIYWFSHAVDRVCQRVFRIDSVIVDNQWTWKLRSSVTVESDFKLPFRIELDAFVSFFFSSYIYIFALCRAQHESASDMRESKRCNNNNNQLGCWDVLCVFIFSTWISFAIFLDWYMIVWQSGLDFVVINCVRCADV